MQEVFNNFSSFFSFSSNFYCLMHDCVWHDLLRFVLSIYLSCFARIFFNMFLDDCLLQSFFLKFQNLLMTIKDYFYKNWYVFFKSNFFNSKTNMYFLDLIFFNIKLICIFIKYRSNFFQNSKLICIFIKYKFDFF